MTKYAVSPIDEEITFHRDEIIVSKTDLKGHILYANDVFCRVAGLSTKDTIGKPHSLIRHPDMPRAVFKLLWDAISDGREIFAYVKNMAVCGRYYWVFAHVTPSFNESGDQVGYHSNRRSPSPKAIKAIAPLYQTLREEEARHANAKDGLTASYQLLSDQLNTLGLSYDEFIWSLGEGDV